MKHSTPVPTDEDFNFVHAPPSKLLYPSLVPADKMYHLVMKEKLWRSWSGDSFGIRYLDQDSGATDGSNKPFEVDIKGRAVSIRDRMVVQDSRTKAPVAVILGMILKFETQYKIYTFEPNFEGQEPSENLKHDDRDLYEWAKCKDKFFSVRKTMKTVDGVEYVMDGCGPIFTWYRQMVISRNGKPCMHCKEINLGIAQGNQWELRIGPGIDPVLMVAFVAVMDEMNEDKSRRH
mmetsp:Transcript_13030/g.28215  ORF Transcript_13030/g.28215 Transcript_13030/m.28215 type:complete len:233 (-) Transcript_13030:45-743(-)